MSYSTGGLIEASDYNALANAGGGINWVWGTGMHDQGYGQTNISNVSIGGTVTATQWASLINAINNSRFHQGGTSSLSAPTAGTTVSYLSTLVSTAASAYAARNNYASQGATTTGTTYSPTATAAVNTAYGETTVGFLYANFASGDAARYFFNAGGQLKYYASVVSNDGSGRSNGIRDNIGTVNYTMGNPEYRALGGWSVVVNNTEAGTYSGDYVWLYTQSASGTNVSGHGDLGNKIGFAYNLFSAAHGAFNSSLNITVNHRVDIVYPETTYLTSSWGTPTISTT